MRLRPAVLALAASLALPVAALCAPPPYPASPVIEEILWAPRESIIRHGEDGDNWPMTWASNDALYTTWGDGTGFAPKVEKKLSCGFARVTGMPPDFRGENVRSPAEQLGGGRLGLKAWGALAIADRIYLAFGHANRAGGESVLAWSDDFAKSWKFSDWRFAEFGLPGFVNFGKAYAGARDSYVYAYSHDGALADTPADRFVLMRVPTDKVSERASWEFFTGLDKAGSPAWSKAITARGTVFSHPGKSLRSAMTYHAGLKRYLWCQQFPQPTGHVDRGDTRFEGGFGIFDAPEPWGPWTTAFYTEKWDVGPGEHADFPTKWMSADGRTAWLVFSGDDAFCVRKAEFKLKRH